MADVDEIRWGSTESTRGPVDVVPRYWQETEEQAAQRRADQQTRDDEEARRQQRADRRARLAPVARELSSYAFEVPGLGLVSWGLFTQWPWVGIVVAGLSLILVGVSISPPTRRAPEPEQPAGPRDPAFPYMPMTGSEGDQT